MTKLMVVVAILLVLALGVYVLLFYQTPIDRAVAECQAEAAQTHSGEFAYACFVQ